MKILIVNCTGEDIRLIHIHLASYAQTGIIHPDIADIFNLQRIVNGEEIRVIVNFADEVKV